MGCVRGQTLLKRPIGERVQVVMFGLSMRGRGCGLMRRRVGCTRTTLILMGGCTMTIRGWDDEDEDEKEARMEAVKRLQIPLPRMAI